LFVFPVVVIIGVSVRVGELLCKKTQARTGTASRLGIMRRKMLPVCKTIRVAVQPRGDRKREQRAGSLPIKQLQAVVAYAGMTELIRLGSGKNTL
jgi:hypothetical protein